jgi:hypothetical protein
VQIGAVKNNSITKQQFNKIIKYDTKKITGFDEGILIMSQLHLN